MSIVERQLSFFLCSHMKCDIVQQKIGCPDSFSSLGVILPIRTASLPPDQEPKDPVALRVCVQGKNWRVALLPGAGGSLSRAFRQRIRPSESNCSPGRTFLGYTRFFFWDTSKFCNNWLTFPEVEGSPKARLAWTSPTWASPTQASPFGPL